MTHLATYLKQSSTRQSDFAQRVGVSQGVVSRLARGLALPSLALAIRIEAETGGRVSVRSWSIQRQSVEVRGEAA